MMRIALVFIVSALAQGSYGQSSCPGDVQMSLMGCAQMMEGYMQSSSQAEQLQHCGDARRGLACAKGVLRGCQGIEGTPIEQIANSLKQIEGPLNMYCPPAEEIVPEGVTHEEEIVPEVVTHEEEIVPEVVTPEEEIVPARNTPSPNRVRKCSGKDQRRLQKCSRRLQRYATETPMRCRKVNKALDCMGILMNRCSAIIGQQTINRVNALRDMLMQHCVETNEVPEDEDEDEDEEVGEVTDAVPVEETCPPDYGISLNQCVENLTMRMGASSTGSVEELAQHCQQVTDSLDCIAHFFRICANQPAVIQMSAALDVGQIRTSISGICSAGGPEGNTGEEGDDCPAGYMMRLQECLTSMQGFDPSQMQGMDREMCSTVIEGVDCLADITAKCSDKPEIGQLTSVINVDQTKTMVDAHCRGGAVPTFEPSSNVDCPADFAQRITACVEPLQSLSNSPQAPDIACSMASDSINCVENIINNCRGESEIQALTSMMNMNATRQLIAEQCSEVNTGSEGHVITPGPCDGRRPSDELQRCNGFLTSFQQSSGDMSQKCRELFEGFDCFEELIARCPDDLTVVSFTSVVDIGDIRSSMSAYCPTRRR